MIDLKTYGDLKKLINSISTKQKGEKIISKGKEFALDQVLGLIPGASNAKTAFDFIRTAISKPDTKKTNTWLDKLDIDDEMSQIVDDTVENGFMQAMAKTIENESDSKPLEDDFNMNAKMVNYLKSTYSGRTISGIKEIKMKKSELKQLIKEEINNILTEATTPPSPAVQGTIKNELFKKLGVANFNPANFSTTINLVKQGKVLNPAANKILADVMIAMIKTNDDSLLNQIFNNLKQIETK
jgi:hypothetical protein